MLDFFNAPQKYELIRENTTVTIVDINGKLVKTIELNSNETIDIRAFEKGIYFVNCNNQTQQLIKL
jgi:flagellar hook assembly protein FlgD